MSKISSLSPSCYIITIKYIYNTDLTNVYLLIWSASFHLFSQVSIVVSFYHSLVAIDF